jgi:hypothetical protein
VIGKACAFRARLASLLSGFSYPASQMELSGRTADRL